jgi:hypothetical protein
VSIAIPTFISQNDGATIKEKNKQLSVATKIVFTIALAIGLIYTSAQTPPQKTANLWISNVRLQDALSSLAHEYQTVIGLQAANFPSRLFSVHLDNAFRSMPQPTKLRPLLRTNQIKLLGFGSLTFTAIGRFIFTLLH